MSKFFRIYKYLLANYANMYVLKNMHMLCMLPFSKNQLKILLFTTFAVLIALYLKLLRLP